MIQVEIYIADMLEDTQIPYYDSDNYMRLNYPLNLNTWRRK